MRKAEGSGFGGVGGGVDGGDSGGGAREVGVLSLMRTLVSLGEGSGSAASAGGDGATENEMINSALNKTAKPGISSYLHRDRTCSG